MEIRFCSPAFVQPGAPALAWRGDGGGGFFPSSHFKATSEYTLTTDVDPQAPPAELHQRSISIHSTLSPAKHCTCPTPPPRHQCPPRFIPSTWRTNVITVLQMFFRGGWGGVSSDGTWWRTFECFFTPRRQNRRDDEVSDL